MTAQQMNDMITDLQEVRSEITRLNLAAGRTVFNPAATDAVDQWIKALRDEVDL